MADRAPPLHSLQSFRWNLRTLGPLSWLRCALSNAWDAVRGIFWLLLVLPLQSLHLWLTDEPDDDDEGDHD